MIRRHRNDRFHQNMGSNRNRFFKVTTISTETAAIIAVETKTLDRNDDFKQKRQFSTETTTLNRKDDSQQKRQFSTERTTLNRNDDSQQKRRLSTETTAFNRNGFHQKTGVGYEAFRKTNA
ncbi:Hypothetical protein NTJ_12951 [Nesidiocoris tenuis]|uniref:Uncharacterized protein n=1 Tax=Nesidiocoris tenuis TaxID=355587 RepID=A0ABN7B6V7_9HEMI|nr:Hypothetical protein NTJ_12951 [Nesidiocoris tenuis]